MSAAAVGDTLYTASIWVVPILLAVTLHEAAHGYAAWVLGDDTAYRQGRVSLNPFRHIDPFGTVILPAMLLIMDAGFLFGYAKPVPVNFRRLRQPRWDMIKVAAAGPAANLGIAVASVGLFQLAYLLPVGVDDWARESLKVSVFFNLLLAFLNMLPLPPLDGGRVAVGVLPRGPAMMLARTERFGIFLLLGIFILLPMISRQLGIPINPFQWLILEPVWFVFETIDTVIGIGLK